MLSKINYFVFASVIFIAACTIYFAENVSIGVRKGLLMCVNSVIPSLYIFMIICIFIVTAGLFENNIITDAISRMLFGFKGRIGSISILSLMCGYPVGSSLINQAYVNGKISNKTAKKMVCYCINPGPAFVINTVGLQVYGNKNIGIIILISTTLSSIIAGRVLIINNENEIKKVNIDTRINYLDAFINSVRISTKSISQVCGWVIIASAITEIIKGLTILQPLVCMLEVTSGIELAAKQYSVYFSSFLIGFGGISVLMQAKSAASKVNPSFIKMFISKALQGLSSAIITYILLKIFPQTIMANNYNGIALSSDGGNLFSAINVIMFLLFTIVFIHQKTNIGGKL